ncbi:ABC transporter permease [Sulfitobacter alexandrii]|uniref:ABC transporter permease n=1 Tax=Sulfitobacter alexandrii TaxID=1917485 RepID=A0A1J0WJS2_9RHOB|nr:iron chelate uptake ABC transporter family permease subunit [Sulfitobacter alexandrii]APE44562.1 ABC transporter permease [Sulfitobacter alexandrii]
MAYADHQTARRVAGLRRTRQRHRIWLAARMLGLLLVAAALTLGTGPSMTAPIDVLRSLAGQEIPGTSFAVRELRLPRLLVSILVGMSLGLGGVVFQTLLRNPLASPDIIGISAGASAAAVFAIVVLGWSGSAVSVMAVAAGLAVALVIYLLAWRDGLSGARLILVGIGISAILNSLLAYLLARAPAWSLQEALRWLSGSVNGATLEAAFPVLGALAVFGGVLLLRRKSLEILRLGDDMASALGVPLAWEKMLIVVSAVALIAVATAVAGPVAFVAFLSGPIAARLCPQGPAPLVPSAMVGALLVVAADFAGQHLLPARYPVGIVTGALGAPYLIFLIVKSNRVGRSI